MLHKKIIITALASVLFFSLTSCNQINTDNKKQQTGEDEIREVLKENNKLNLQGDGILTKEEKENKMQKDNNKNIDTNNNNDNNNDEYKDIVLKEKEKRVKSENKNGRIVNLVIDYGNTDASIPDNTFPGMGTNIDGKMKEDILKKRKVNLELSKKNITDLNIVSLKKEINKLLKDKNIKIGLGETSKMVKYYKRDNKTLEKNIKENVDNEFKLISSIKINEKEKISQSKIDNIKKNIDQSFQKEFKSLNTKENNVKTIDLTKKDNFNEKVALNYFQTPEGKMVPFLTDIYDTGNEKISKQDLVLLENYLNKLSDTNKNLYLENSKWNCNNDNICTLNAEYVNLIRENIILSDKGLINIVGKQDVKDYKKYIEDGDYNKDLNEEEKGQIDIIKNQFLEIF